MNSEGYDAFDDPYAYPGTTVLKNILDLRDPDTLEAFEVEISTLRAEEPLPEGTFDAAHYCAVHHHLFQDVYDWAGQYRTVRTSKGGNLFCYPEHIHARMEKLFRGLRVESISLIAATQYVESHLGRQWQRWSRHLAPGVWKSGIDSLESNLSLVNRELRSAAVLKAA